jgi:hypothetical protein
MGSGDPSGLQNRRELALLALVSSTLTRFRQSSNIFPVEILRLALLAQDFGSRLGRRESASSSTLTRFRHFLFSAVLPPLYFRPTGANKDSPNRYACRYVHIGAEEVGNAGQSLPTTIIELLDKELLILPQFDLNLRLHPHLVIECNTMLLRKLLARCAIFVWNELRLLR